MNINYFYRAEILRGVFNHQLSLAIENCCCHNCRHCCDLLSKLRVYGVSSPFFVPFNPLKSSFTLHLRKLCAFAFLVLFGMPHTLFGDFII